MVAEEVDTNIVGKTAVGMAAGTAALVGGATVGTIASVVLLPVLPYLMYNWLMSYFDRKNSTEIEKRFFHVAIQMGKIYQHLKNIEGALFNIEYTLSKTRKAEDKALKQLQRTIDGNEQLERQVGRVINQADKLISACKTYFDCVPKR